MLLSSQLIGCQDFMATNQLRQGVRLAVPVGLLVSRGSANFAY
jgi:hypothetical protein